MKEGVTVNGCAGRESKRLRRRRSVVAGAKRRWLGLAGGMENMTQAPFVVAERGRDEAGVGERWKILMAGLTDTYCGLPMAAERGGKLADQYGITRKDADETRAQPAASGRGYTGACRIKEECAAWK